MRRKTSILQIVGSCRTENSLATFREAEHLLCGKTTAVCYKERTKQGNTLRKQKAEIFIVKAYGTYSYHDVLRGYYHVREDPTSAEEFCPVSNNACHQMQRDFHSTYMLDSSRCMV